MENKERRTREYGREGLIKKIDVTIERLINVTEIPHSKRVAGSLPNPTIKFKDLLENFDNYKNEYGNIVIGIESLDQYKILRYNLEKSGYFEEKDKNIEGSLITSWESYPPLFNTIVFKNVKVCNEYQHWDMNEEEDEYTTCWFFELIFDDINE